MYGSDIDTEPEIDPVFSGNPIISDNPESSDEIDFFKSNLSPSPQKPKRKRLTKKVSKIVDRPESSDSEPENEISEKLHVKKLSLNEVASAIHNSDKSSMSEDEPQRSPTEPVQSGSVKIAESSDDDIKIVKKRRRAILESDSE